MAASTVRSPRTRAKRAEYESFFTEKDEVTHYPIVALSSLTRLRENGKFVEQTGWHFSISAIFVNYKTVLSFSKDGKMMWTKPEPYFSAYRDIEKRSQMCEVECAPQRYGRGDELSAHNAQQFKKNKLTFELFP